MNRKTIVLGFVLLLLVILSPYFINNGNEGLEIDESKTIIESHDSDVILFYGENCPYCTLVDNFVEENNVSGQVDFAHKEVYYNKQNSNQLVEKAMICDLPTDSIAVPFLWDGETCYVGYVDIISFFESVINQN